MTATRRPSDAVWLARTTARLLPPLAFSALARITNRLLAVALLVVPVVAIAAASAGQDVSATRIALVMVATALAKAVLRYAEHYVGHWVAFTALQRLRELFFATLVPQAPAATAGRAGGELTERATRDIDRIEVFFAHTFPPAIAAIVVPAIAVSWVAVTVDARLALVAGVLVAAALVAGPAMSKRAGRQAAASVAQVRGNVAGHLADDIQGVRTIHALGAQTLRLDGAARLDTELVQARSVTGRLAGLRAATTSLLHTTTVVVPVAVGVGWGVEPAGIAACVAVCVGLWGTVAGVDDFAVGLDAALAATGRIRDVITAPPAVSDPETPDEVPLTTGMHVDSATVRFTGASTAALDDVSASFASGQWTCVVGVSGSGKSTLAILLVRGRDPDAGRVLLADVDVSSLRLEALRERAALVTQRPVLLRGSLADNLRLATPDADDGDLWAALDVVGLRSWVESLPEGIESPTHERGLGVSGGQLQRLAVARALVGQPGVLILDEALSQLDTATAVDLRARLRTHGRESSSLHTVIEITHRVDLIPDKDPVVVLDAGRVVETGLAGDLRHAGGAFARLELR